MVGDSNGRRHLELRACFRDVADRAIDDDGTIGLNDFARLQDTLAAADAMLAHTQGT